MILFLRDENNNTIVDLDCWIDSDDDYKFIELSVTVDIENYSVLLMANLFRKHEVVRDFSYIQELREWLWEDYFNGQKSDPDKYDDVLARLKTMLKTRGERYDLTVVDD